MRSRLVYRKWFLMSFLEETPRLASRVQGQDFARNSLAQAMASGRVAHAYLFTGPEGVGKRLFAEEMSRALICSQNGEGSGDFLSVGACGVCASCRVPLLGHPAVQILEAARGGTIEIDLVREAVTQLSLRSGGRRAVLIDGADQLREAAANALLKTLEEPPIGIVFFLITDRHAHLLETIHSRTQRVSFTVLSLDTFSEVLSHRLQNVEVDEWGTTREGLAETLHRIAGGSPGVATRLLDGIENCGGLNRLRDLLRGVGGERPSSLIDYLPPLSKETARARVQRLLELVQCGLWGESDEDLDARHEAGERTLLVAELIRGLAGGRSVELTLEVLSRVLRGSTAAEVSRRLPASF